jgi:hypothetical protein
MHLATRVTRTACRQRRCIYYCLDDEMHVAISSFYYYLSLARHTAAVRWTDVLTCCRGALLAPAALIITKKIKSFSLEALGHLGVLFTLFIRYPHMQLLARVTKRWHFGNILRDRSRCVPGHSAWLISDAIGPVGTLTRQTSLLLLSASPG